MTNEEAKSCIGTIEMLQRLAYNIHGVMDVIDADNCKKIIKVLEQEPCEDVLDKIKAEILEKFDNCSICEWFENYDYDENDISEYMSVGHILDIIDIIDKYIEGSDSE